MGRPEKYPWSAWFDGKAYMLKSGVDYPGTMKPDSFRQMIYQAARRRGLVVHVDSGDGWFRVRVESAQNGVRENVNWDRLFDGQLHPCRRGEFFTGAPWAFVQAVLAEARKRDIKVRARAMDEALVYVLKES